MPHLLSGDKISKITPKVTSYIPVDCLTIIMQCTWRTAALITASVCLWWRSFMNGLKEYFKRVSSDESGSILAAVMNTLMTHICTDLFCVGADVNSKRTGSRSSIDWTSSLTLFIVNSVQVESDVFNNNARQSIAPCWIFWVSCPALNFSSIGIHSCWTWRVHLEYVQKCWNDSMNVERF